jgi:hypothetical protein
MAELAVFDETLLDGLRAQLNPLPKPIEEKLQARVRLQKKHEVERETLTVNRRIERQSIERRLISDVFSEPLSLPRLNSPRDGLPRRSRAVPSPLGQSSDSDWMELLDEVVQTTARTEEVVDEDTSLQTSARLLQPVTSTIDDFTDSMKRSLGPLEPQLAEAADGGAQKVVVEEEEEEDERPPPPDQAQPLVSTPQRRIDLLPSLEVSPLLDFEKLPIVLADEGSAPEEPPAKRELPQEEASTTEVPSSQPTAEAPIEASQPEEAAAPAESPEQPESAAAAPGSSEQPEHATAPAQSPEQPESAAAAPESSEQPESATAPPESGGPPESVAAPPESSAPPTAVTREFSSPPRSSVPPVDYDLSPGSRRMRRKRVPPGLYVQTAAQTEGLIPENELDGILVLGCRRPGESVTLRAVEGDGAAPEGAAADGAPPPSEEAPPPEDATSEGKPRELPEEPKPEEPKAEEPKSEEPKSEEPKVEEPKSEEPKAEEPKAEEPKAEEPKAEEPKPEGSQSEEPKSEEAKPEEPVTGDAVAAERSLSAASADGLTTPPRASFRVTTPGSSVLVSFSSQANSPVGTSGRRRTRRKRHIPERADFEAQATDFDVAVESFW